MEAIAHRIGKTSTSVLVGGRLVGSIKKAADGLWYYTPKGGKRGKGFDSYGACKQSLGAHG